MKNALTLAAAVLIAITLATATVSAAPAGGGSAAASITGAEDIYYDFELWWWSDNYGWFYFGKFDMRYQAEQVATEIESYGFGTKITRIRASWWLK
jgi:hypothetical protein